MDLWTTDPVDGEKWLINPQLLLVGNPPKKRRTKKMARKQPAALRRYWAKHRKTKTNPARRRRRVAVAASNPHRRRARRRAKRNYFAPGLMVNPRRRRRAARRNPQMKRSSRRRASRNPQFLGSLPPLKSIAFVGAGLVVPSLVTPQLMKLLPVEYQTSKPVSYAVQAAAAFLPAVLVRKMVSREAGNLMLLGSAAAFAVKLLTDTGVLASIGLSGYPMQSQPLLGFYPNRAQGLGRYNTPSFSNRSVAIGLPPMIANTPARLNPQERF